MGYRSDVVIAFAFKSKAEADEVLAIYRMDSRVQEHDLEKEWRTHNWGAAYGLTFTATSVKWYDSYSDVQGLEHMSEVVRTFSEHRPEFEFAYRKIRIGEEDNDIESDSYNSEKESCALQDELWERMGLHREITTSF